MDPGAAEDPNMRGISEKTAFDLRDSRLKLPMSLFSLPREELTD